ncbi:hypothetical protein [Bacillus atrophaeus]|uniref:hypothetical protein n=1 Tax=Bacillus atrophaeus TaxID=1452 RepID=UPI002E24C5F5|nr:hypothetical protein [Bacillus atrophaeus]
MGKTNILSYNDIARNGRIVIGSQWVCINGKNAGRIAEVRIEPLRNLYWMDIDDFVEYSDGNLFVYKQD